VRDVVGQRPNNSASVFLSPLPWYWFCRFACYLGEINRPRIHPKKWQAKEALLLLSFIKQKGGERFLWCPTSNRSSGLAAKAGAKCVLVERACRRSPRAELRDALGGSAAALIMTRAKENLKKCGPAF